MTEPDAHVSCNTVAIPDPVLSVVAHHLQKLSDLHSKVRSEMQSSWAMVLADLPWRSRPRISRSRLVSSLPG